VTLIRNATAPLFVVVWKDGTYKQTAKPGQYENDPNWLVTVPVLEEEVYVPTSGSGGFP